MYFKSYEILKDLYKIPPSKFNNAASQLRTFPIIWLYNPVNGEEDSITHSICGCTLNPRERERHTHTKRVLNLLYNVKKSIGHIVWFRITGTWWFSFIYITNTLQGSTANLRRRRWADSVRRVAADHRIKKRECLHGDVSSYLFGTWFPIAFSPCCFRNSWMVKYRIKLNSLYSLVSRI